jgi:hypothetical protein
LFDVEAFDPLGAENRGKAREERALLVAEMGLGDRSKRPGEDQHPIGIAVVTGLLELLEERQHFAVLGVRDGLELLD